MSQTARTNKVGGCAKKVKVLLAKVGRKGN